jgi:hypothetical protein
MITAADASTTTALIVLAVVGVVVVYLWTALALAAVFRKSGEPSWKAWVPFLNEAVLFQLGGYSGWLVLLYLIPGLGALAVWVVRILACHRIGSSFGFGVGMTVVSALFLPIWASIVGFGPARWVGIDRAPRRGEGDVLASTIPPRPPAPARQQPFPDIADHTEPAMGGRSVSPYAARAASGEWTSGPRSVASSTGWAGFDLYAVSELTGEVTGAVAGAPRPISAVPAPVAPAPQSDVPPPVTRVPAGPVPPPPGAVREPWAPARSPMPESDAFAETSGPVSAIVGAPVAGGPLSARSSVSAQSRLPEVPEDPLEATVIARRRRTIWSLVLPTGEAVAIGSDVVIVGRRPAADPDRAGAQLIAVNEETVSKTHARLELRDEVWYITDLGSTNGVLLATMLGTDVEASPGVEVEAGEQFLLGDARLRLVRSGE